MLSNAKPIKPALGPSKLSDELLMSANGWFGTARVPIATLSAESTPDAAEPSPKDISNTLVRFAKVVELSGLKNGPAHVVQFKLGIMRSAEPVSKSIVVIWVGVPRERSPKYTVQYEVNSAQISERKE